MMSQPQREKLVSSLLRASYEAVDMEDLGFKILPLLDRLVDTSTSLLWRYNEAGRIVPIAGGMCEPTPRYARDYFSSDPLQRYLRETNPVLLHSSEMSVWQEYLASAAYNECASPNQVDNFLHLRLTDCGNHEPGMIGMILSRTFSQPDFSDDDKRLIRKILPALASFGRRYARLDQRIRAQPFIEALFELSSHPAIILDSRGGFVWASDRAEALLHISADGCKKVPEPLETAAQRLGVLLTTDSDTALLPTSIKIPRNDQPPLDGTLRLGRMRNGLSFIVVELEEPDSSPVTKETAARHGLTKTEAKVLHLLSLGLTDREIGRRLFVSFATVRSHVNHILGKLAVKSRTQAALIARGHKTDSI